MKKMVINNIKSRYYHWLCNRIGASTEATPNGATYFILLKDLHTKEFRHHVPNDYNRAFEGLQLRDVFADEEGIAYIDNYLYGDCTMLELIIGLALRCEDIMSGREEVIPASDWFWRLIRNAGLDRFTDEEYFDYGGSAHVDHLLEKIIERTYHRNGFGGFFPLKKHKKDQRKVELWFQMHAYLVENYFFEEEV